MNSDPTSPTVDQPTSDLTIVNQPSVNQPIEDQPIEDQVAAPPVTSRTTPSPAAPSRTIRPVLLAGVLVALLLAAVVSFYASSSPDGLEKVATDKGIAQTEKTHHLADSPFAGYGTKGVSNARLSTGLAGVAGVAVTLALGTGLALAVRRRDSSPR